MPPGDFGMPDATRTGRRLPPVRRAIMRRVETRHAARGGAARMTASELATLVQIMRERGRPEQPTIPDLRARYELVGEKFPAPAEARIEKVVAGGRPAEIVPAPEAAHRERTRL